MIKIKLSKTYETTSIFNYFVECCYVWHQIEGQERKSASLYLYTLRHFIHHINVVTITFRALINLLSFMKYLIKEQPIYTFVLF